MAKSKYKNIIIVGNGFDCWQRLPTSYEQFRLYYAEHIEEVAKELGCSVFTITDQAGQERRITAVEMVYGDPFAPHELKEDFFWNLEARLDQIDDQMISLYFGRGENDVDLLNRAVDEALLLIRRLFCDWIATIEIVAQETDYCFSDDCFVINFNYTDTVEKRFGVKSENVYHIHGDAHHPETIIVGHSSHPEKPFEELKERHFIRSVGPTERLPRIDALYAVENALYKTDKHIADNIDQLCKAFVERDVHIEDIENIYVLGHSFAQADVAYFEFIDQVTRCGCDFERIAPVGHLDKELLALLSLGGELSENLLMSLIELNMAYAMHHRERIVPAAEDLFPEMKAVDELFGGLREYIEADAVQAVKQRFWYEQAERTNMVLEELAKKYHVPVPKECHSILGYMNYKDYGHTPRRKNAQWHISFYSKEDKKRIERVMKAMQLKRFTLYPSIDECIARFSTKSPAKQGR